MRSLRLALVGLGLAGFTIGAVSVPVILASDSLGDERIAIAIFGPLIAWAFIGTGLFAWWRRPDNAFGALMTAVGFVWSLGALTASNVPGVFIIGIVFSPLPLRAAAAHAGRVSVGAARVDRRSGFWSASPTSIRR